MAFYPGFFEGVLSKLGAPVTQNNLDFFNRWAQFEKSNSIYNTLNTTLNKPGATNFNSVGVKNYPNLETGIQATADTLKLRYYAPIVSALRQNKNFNYYINNQEIIKSINTWGTRTFSKTLIQPTSPANGTNTSTDLTNPTQPGDKKKKIILWSVGIVGGITLFLIGRYFYKKQKQKQ